MKYFRMGLTAVLVLGLVCARPFFALAKEGAKEADGEETTMAPPTGEHEGGLVPTTESDDVAVLTEAAAFLDTAHPELAAKLRAFAVKEQGEKKLDEPMPSPLEPLPSH